MTWLPYQSQQPAGKFTSFLLEILRFVDCFSVCVADCESDECVLGFVGTPTPRGHQGLMAVSVMTWGWGGRASQPVETVMNLNASDILSLSIICESYQRFMFQRVFA